MQHSLGVRSLQGARQLGDHGGDEAVPPLLRQGAPGFLLLGTRQTTQGRQALLHPVLRSTEDVDRLLEGDPLDEREHDADPSLLAQDVVDGDDVGARQPRQDARLGDQALRQRRHVPIRLDAHRLERHSPAELEVARLVDDSDPAATPLGEDLVATGDARAHLQVPGQAPLRLVGGLDRARQAQPLPFALGERQVLVEWDGRVVLQVPGVLRRQGLDAEFGAILRGRQGGGRFLQVGRVPLGDSSEVVRQGLLDGCGALLRSCLRQLGHRIDGPPRW